MTDKIKLLEEIIESCTDRYGDNRNEIAKALFLLSEIKQAINYTRCCETLVCERCKQPNDNDCTICYDCTEEIQKLP